MLRAGDARDGTTDSASNGVEPAVLDATARAVHAAFEAPRPAGALGDGQLRDALRRVSSDARRAGVPVERVIVLVKTRWHATGEERAYHTLVAADERLAALVSTCIAGYYGAD